MRSSPVRWDLAYSGWDLAQCWLDLNEWLQCLTANAEVASVLGSISASSDTVDYEGHRWSIVENSEQIKIGQKLLEQIKN
jgi:hypothetical protein